MPGTSDRLSTQRSRNRMKFKTPPQSTELPSSAMLNAKRERRTPPDKITHLNINGVFSAPMVMAGLVSKAATVIG